MEKQPERNEPKERKEGRAWWSKLGVVALASSMAAACVDIERRSTAQVGSESAARILAEHGMQVAGEDPQISWEKEAHKDAQGYWTGSTLHAKITTRDKVYRIDLERELPLYRLDLKRGLSRGPASQSGAMDKPVIPVDGSRVSSGGADVSSVSWYDMTSEGDGVVLKFTPLVNPKGETALQIRTQYYEDGKVRNDQSTVIDGEPNAER